MSDQPPIPDLGAMLVDVTREAKFTQRVNELVARQQRVLREWKAAQAEGDAEGEGLCRRAAGELVAEYHALYGRRVEVHWYDDQAYMVDLDEIDKLLNPENLKWI